MTTFSGFLGSQTEVRQWKTLKEVPTFILSEAKHVSASARSAFLCTQNDDVFAIGENHSGILGFDSTKVQLIEGRQPKKQELLSRIQVEEFVFGQRHAIARTKQGEVYSMGCNQEGELGLGHRNWVICPQKVGDNLTGHRIKSVRCGSQHTVCLSTEGIVFAWGPNSFGFGLIHSHAVLGVNVPRQVALPPSEVIGIACSKKSSFLWTSDGKVYGWGSNAHKELCSYKAVDSPKPRQIEIPELDCHVVKVICGAHHVIALSRERSIFMWGFDPENQINTSVPLKLVRLPDPLVEMAFSTGSLLVKQKSASNIYAMGATADNEKSLHPVQQTHSSFDHALADNSSFLYVSWSAPSSLTTTTKNLMVPTAKLHSTGEATQTSGLVEFIAEGNVIRGYLPILERNSPLKKQIDRDGTKNSNRVISLEVKDFSFAAFRAFIKYLHHDFLDVDDVHLIEMLEVAHVYEDAELRQSAVKRLQNSIQVGNVIDIYKAAVKYNTLDLRVTALSFMGTEFWQIMQRPDFLMSEDGSNFVGADIMQDLQSMNLIPAARKSASPVISVERLTSSSGEIGNIQTCGNGQKAVEEMRNTEFPFMQTSKFPGSGRNSRTDDMALRELSPRFTESEFSIHVD